MSVDPALSLNAINNSPLSNIMGGASTSGINIPSTGGSTQSSQPQAQPIDYSGSGVLGGGLSLTGPTLAGMDPLSNGSLGSFGASSASASPQMVQYLHSQGGNGQSSGGIDIGNILQNSTENQGARWLANGLNNSLGLGLDSSTANGLGGVGLNIVNGNFQGAATGLAGMGIQDALTQAGLGDLAPGVGPIMALAQGADPVSLAENFAVNQAISMAMDAIFPGSGELMNIPVVGDAIGSVVGDIGDAVSSVAGCFIVQATHKGLGMNPENEDVKTMVDWRERMIAANPALKNIVKAYYVLSPKAISAVERHDNSGKIYARIYGNYVKPCVAAIKANHNVVALHLFSKMVLEFVEFAHEVPDSGLSKLTTAKLHEIASHFYDSTLEQLHLGER